jgi:hypothetical protein
LAGEYIGLTGKGRVEYNDAATISRDVIKRFTEDEGIRVVKLIRAMCSTCTRACSNALRRCLT